MRRNGWVAAAVVVVITAVAMVFAVANQPNSGRGLPVAAAQGQGHIGIHRIAVIGDSYTGGSDVGGVGPAGWPALVWGSLQSEGIPVAPDVSGQGGSGYVTRGGAGTTFPEEALRVVRPDDEVVVFFGSNNDASQPPFMVALAARNAFASVRAIAPSATLLVIGPAWPHGDPPPDRLQLRDVLQQEAALAGATFVDPIAEGWLRNPPGLIGWDRVHPTNEGHQYLAGYIEPRIREALLAR